MGVWFCSVVYFQNQTLIYPIMDKMQRPHLCSYNWLSDDSKPVLEGFELSNKYE